MLQPSCVLMVLRIVVQVFVVAAPLLESAGLVADLVLIAESSNRWVAAFFLVTSLNRLVAGYLGLLVAFLVLAALLSRFLVASVVALLICLVARLVIVLLLRMLPVHSILVDRDRDMIHGHFYWQLLVFEKVKGKC